MKSIIIMFLVILIPIAIAHDISDSKTTTFIKKEFASRGLLSRMAPIHEGALSDEDSSTTPLLHTIKDAVVYGQDMIESYTRLNDSINVELLVKIDNDCDISPDQLKVGAVDFYECVNESGCYHRCKFQSSQVMLSPQTQTVNVLVYDDDGIELSFSKPSIYFYVDYLPPEVSSITFDPPYSASGSSVLIGAQINEYSYSTSSSSYCVGVKSYDIYKDSSKLKSVNVNGRTGLCQMSVEHNITTSELQLTDGYNNICIVAYDTFGQNSTKQCANFMYDSKAPVLSLSNIDIEASDGSDISYYKIGDDLRLSFEINVDENISGIKSGSIKVNLSEFGQTELYSPSSCGTDTYCVNDVTFPNNSSSVNNKVYIEAEDNAGNSIIQSFSITRSLTVDENAPTITAFIIKDNDGTELDQRIIPGDFYADVIIQIKENESGLDESSVMGDFSNFLIQGSVDVQDPFSQAGQTQSGTATCQYTDDYYVCLFDNVYIDLNQSGSKSFTVNATDNSGNTKTQTFSYAFEVDATAPEVSAYRTDYSQDNMYWLGKNNNTIYVDLIEAGIGLYNKTIYLDGSNINSNNKIEPYNCTGGWICEFRGVDVTSASDGSNISFGLNMDSADDLGNEITESYPGYFIIDLTAPSFINISQNSSTGFCPTYLDNLFITAYVTESGTEEVTISVDADEISTYTNPVFSNSCELEDNETNLWKCELTITDLNTYYTDATLDVVLSDGVGNNHTESIDVEVCKHSSDTPVCVTISYDTPETLPEKVDLLAMSTTSVPLFIHLNLNVCADGIIYTKSIDCSDTGNLDSTYAPYLIADSTDDPYLSMRLKGTEIVDEDDDDKMDIKCNLSMKMRVGSTVYEDLEQESISLNVETYNNPLGSIGDEANETIQELEDKIDGLETEIKDMEDDLETWTTICQIVDLILKIVSLIQAVSSILTGIGCAIAAFPPLAGVGEAIAKAGCWVSSIFNFLGGSWYTDSPMLQKAIGIIGFLMKLQCAMVSCKICTTSYWQGAFFSAVGMAANFVATGYTPPSEISRTEGKWVRDDDKSAESGSTMYRYEGDIQYVEDANLYDSYSNIRAHSGPMGWTEKDESWSEKIASDWSSGITGGWRSDPSMANHPDNLDYSADSVDDGYIMNPYKSIHFAKGCYCKPGEIYNKRKMRQLYCIQKDCIQQNALVGLPTYACDLQMKENWCLYVDSAEYLKYGADNIFQEVMDNLVDIIFSDMLAAALAIVGIACQVFQLILGQSLATCNADHAPVCSSKWWVIGCGLVSAAQGIMSLMSLMNNGFDTDSYNSALQGTDYCS
ncbi:hypothetical protein K9M79_00210 [Candidatus Woesearchaeota archaeon]|nr:hypothetical protein [Candidatus Woesearchaeota archaeon]